MPKPKRAKDKVLKPVRPNLGIEVEYRKRLDRLIAEMQASTIYYVRAAYRANTPRIAQDNSGHAQVMPSLAQDESPAGILGRTIKALAKRWLKRFDEAAPKLADWFSQAVNTRSQAALKKILKDGGISVEFKMTPAMRDIMDATVSQNVSLIKSIPSQYFGEIEGMVMRSVQTGRDLGTLTSEIEQRFGVTRRRAALIAKTQNNLATASMAKAKNLEAGITEAIWVHSGGGREPRPTHLAAGRAREKYSIAEGWFDPDPKVRRHIQPGELINCRCVGRPVIKGFS